MTLDQLPSLAADLHFWGLVPSLRRRRVVVSAECLPGITTEIDAALPRRKVQRIAVERFRVFYHELTAVPPSRSQRRRAA